MTSKRTANERLMTLTYTQPESGAAENATQMQLMKYSYCIVTEVRAFLYENKVF